MYTLDSVDSFRVSEPADTYIYDIVPVREGLVAISSDDSLRFLNPVALNGPPINTVTHLHTDITCLKTFNKESSAVYTAGRDGKICMLDPRAGATTFEMRTGKMN